MNEVDYSQPTNTIESSSSKSPPLFSAEGGEISFDNSFDSSYPFVVPGGDNNSAISLVVEAEWDPVEFDLKKKSHPKWKKKKSSSSKHPKPRRIQDIRLTRLDSGSDVDEKREEETTHTAHPSCDDSSSWPYEEPDSPWAGKFKMSSSPAAGFEGEFNSSGDPEWGEEKLSKSTGNRSSRRATTSSSSANRKSSSSRRLQQAQQLAEQQRRAKQEAAATSTPEPEMDQSAGSFDLDTASCQSESGGGEDEEDGDYSDEEGDQSERSYTDSPTNGDDDLDLMVTPAMGKTREQRKKPPTLKRGAHQVATPSVVKALKDKQAFTVSDDEGDNDFDFDAECDSDLDSGGSGHSRKSKGENGSRTKRDAVQSVRRPSSTTKKDFKFDRNRSSRDLKAARKANNSFKGGIDMNKSFSAVDAKRRMNRSSSRKQDNMQNSFSGSSRKFSASKSSGLDSKSGGLDSKTGGLDSKSESSRKAPERCKSMGNPNTGASKFKLGLAKFAGTADEPPSATAEKRSYGATLSALKTLSGSDSGSKGSDLAATIMQQVHRNSSLNPIELKIRPKAKMTKQNSLSAAGMARAAAASGDFLKDIPQDKKKEIRRSKTASEKSSSDFNASYHESIARMRKQKMADASERSAMTTTSQSSHELKDSASTTKDRNVARAKSFSASSSRLSIAEATASPGRSPGRSPKRPGMKRGSSKRDVVDGNSSRRGGLQRAMSTKRMYDASHQPPTGTNVISLLKNSEPVTESEMMQKGNRQMFHMLIFKTKMGIDMDELRQKVEGGGKGAGEDQEQDDGGSAASDCSK